MNAIREAAIGDRMEFPARQEASMYFQIVGTIKQVETIAVGGRIHDIMRLQKQYGAGRWRKKKGIATIRTIHGDLRIAELHWYEAHGIGRRKIKIKRFLDVKHD